VKSIAESSYTRQTTEYYCAGKSGIRKWVSRNNVNKSHALYHHKPGTTNQIENSIQVSYHSE